MSDSQHTSDIQALSYESARDELSTLVSQLERGGNTLEDSIELWERGEALANHCQALLLGAKQKLETTPSPSDEDS